MKLDEFVFETLKEIVAGVEKAQRFAEKHDAAVNPRRLVYVPHQRATQGGIRSRRVIFDLSVSASEGKEGKGGLGIVVGPLALGSQGKTDASSVTTSRVRFSVPIMLPPQDNPNIDRE